MAANHRSTCKYMHHMYGGYCGPGFIYIATDGELYKIGCTKIGGKYQAVYVKAGIFAGIHARMGSLNRKGKRVFKLIHVIYSPICVRGLELCLHRLFQSQRIGKEEWFHLTDDDLDFLFSIATFDGYPLNHIGTIQ